MFGKALTASALALGVILSLTACDPPMPPEMVNELAERTFICGDSEVSVSVPSSIDGQQENWTSVLAESCPNMPLKVVGEGKPADIVLSASTPTAEVCKPFTTAPFAIDAAQLVFMNSEISTLYLDGPAIGGILSGKITKWNDPVLAALNADSTLPDTAITVDPAATQAQVDALTSWLSRLTGSEVKLSALKVDNAVGGQDRLYDLAEGSFAIANFADATAAASSTPTIVTGKDLANDIVLADAGAVKSASSQLVAKASANEVAVTLDPSLKPAPPAGSDTALAPYQAIFPINMYLCGTDNLNTRAMARYLLRQDTQGNISSGTAVSLPDAIRFKAIDLVAVGLPTPKPTAAN
jgi:ABC-type phosphate transport system substrate-binding protein